MEQLKIGLDEPILVTGAAGFIGSRLVQNLVDRGLRNIRCLVRPSSNTKALCEIGANARGVRIDVITGTYLNS